MERDSVQGMTVGEVRRILNHTVEIDSDVDDWRLEIELHEPSIGAVASVPIRSIYRGFDWEHGEVLITTTTPVVRKKK